MPKKTKADLDARTAAHKALPPEVREAIDDRAILLRTTFADAADWAVWGRPMEEWGDLPEHNRDNWRAVARLTLPTAEPS